MSAMLVTFAAFSISSIFSLRAISSGVRFRTLLMNKNLHCRVLFYTTLEVYTKFRIVSFLLLSAPFQYAFVLIADFKSFIKRSIFSMVFRKILYVRNTIEICANFAFVLNYYMQASAQTNCVYSRYRIVFCMVIVTSETADISIQNDLLTVPDCLI